jgi:adenylyltransferase/sulfurtransferase
LSISDQELLLFSRQLILKEFNYKIFKSIQEQHIIVVGIGGIGCPLAQYLLATGIKKLTLIDNDFVKLSNLNRQILYGINDINKKKVNVAKEKLNNINPNCNINTKAIKLSEKNIKKYFLKPSLVIDATDNWTSMNLINRYCVKNSIPLINSSVIGYDGQAILFRNKKNHHLCLNCVYPNQNELDLARCDTVGVLGTTAGLTGLIVAQITINFFTNIHNNIDKLMMINSKSMQITQIKVKKNDNCIYKNL